MKLTPREKDKLMLSLAAMVARDRNARGVKLNYPETIALITDFVVEGAREGVVRVVRSWVSGISIAACGRLCGMRAK